MLGYRTDSDGRRGCIAAVFVLLSWAELVDVTSFLISELGCAMLYDCDSSSSACLVGEQSRCGKSFRNE